MHQSTWSLRPSLSKALQAFMWSVSEPGCQVPWAAGTLNSLTGPGPSAFSRSKQEPCKPTEMSTEEEGGRKNREKKRTGKSGKVFPFRNELSTTCPCHLPEAPVQCLVHCQYTTVGCWTDWKDGKERKEWEGERDKSHRQGPDKILYQKNLRKHVLFFILWMGTLGFRVKWLSWSTGLVVAQSPPSHGSLCPVQVSVYCPLWAHHAELY